MTALLEFHKGVTSGGGVLHYTGVPKAVHGALAYASLDRVLNIEPSAVISNKA